MKVLINYTVDVDPMAWANSHGIDVSQTDRTFAFAIRESVKRSLETRGTDYVNGVWPAGIPKFTDPGVDADSHNKWKKENRIGHEKYDRNIY